MINSYEYPLNLLDPIEIDQPLISNPLGDYIQNGDIITKLDTEETSLNLLLAISSSLTIAGAGFPPAALLTIAGAVGVERALEYKIIIQRLRSITAMLLDKFNDEIEITLRVKINTSLIDLLIRMPDKRPFALLLRSNGDSAVRWREDKQQFFVYKVGKTASKWNAMTRTAENLKSTFYLKDLKSPLLGTSRTDRNRTIVKAVVLCNKTTIYRDHAPEYWVNFGRTQNRKVLKVYKDLLFYVVEQENLINFLLSPEK